MYYYKDLKKGQIFKFIDSNNFSDTKSPHKKLECGGCKNLKTGIIMFSNIMNAYSHTQVAVKRN